MSKSQQKITKRCDELEGLFKHFGLVVIAFGPGVQVRRAADLAYRHTMNFNGEEWAWLEPLLEELVWLRNAIKPSDVLMEVFEDEIANEHLEETGQSRSGSSSPGGVNPATLGSALDSINQGLANLGDDANITSAVIHELETLIAKCGPDTVLTKFVRE